MKIIFSKLTFVAIFTLALAFTYSCSEGSGKNELKQCLEKCNDYRKLGGGTTLLISDCQNKCHMKH